MIYKDQVLVVEPTGIETVPAAARHGRARDLFGVWFSANAEIATWMVGVFIAAIFGADLRSATLGIIIGNLLGYAILGVLATFGPRYGVPQMLASRLAFGKRGNTAPAALSFLAGVGWFTINTIFGAYALQTIAHLSYGIALAIMLLLQIVLAVYGYNLIGVFERVSAALLAAGFALLGAVTLPQASWLPGHAPFTGFMFAAALAFAYAMGWVPCASDYSRYLPLKTNPRAVFWYAFVGCALPCIALEILGAAAVTASHVNLRTDVPTDAIAQLLGSGIVARLVLVTIVLGTLTANCMNLYSGALAALVAFDVRIKRAIAALVVGVLGALLALGGSNPAHTAEFYTNFLLLLSYWAAPWAGVVLVDQWQSRALQRDPHVVPPWRTGTLAWLIGVLVSVPFWNQAWFIGVFAHAYPQYGDLSYYVGFLAAAVATMLFGRFVLAT
ncbi:MAG TPA: cytosine permease [Candidatus Acidoferrum sp.]|nr:cytosine permease [Candidatus Acidoferrum sp.]